MHSHIVKSLLY